VNKIILVTSSNFDSEVLKSDKLAAVLFKVKDCKHCLSMESILEQISEDFGDQLKLAFVNIDESPELAAKYGIQIIPRLFLFRNGKSIGSIPGVGQVKEKVVSFIRFALEQGI
jgi:thioredoxin 1